ncbi:MAG: hypothetical protein GF333_07155 [Candidatus Omnitrophica bacterium]|nr:hypothetical protein [Candidatus Omnitrophota bacterium]
MFHNLLQFWKGKGFLNQVLADFQIMLDDTEKMYRAVCRALFFREDQPGLSEKVYSIDQQVNRLEREIRKRVVEHLSVQPSGDVATCLLLMSVVKDAERLGDYAKNLLEVDKLLQKPLEQRHHYLRVFQQLEGSVAKLFTQTKKAFIESDEKIAAETWNVERTILKRCEEIIEGVAQSTDLTANEAACFVLIARYFKRITAHLANIATSVILPLSDLDYFDERRRGE